MESSERPSDQVTKRPSDQLRFTALATAVLLIAAIFRIVQLQDVPPGLAQDEVLNADIVAAIRGGQYALFFREGFGHEPLYHYWSLPFQVLLGDNILSIRLPAVFLGLLLVAATMRWAKRDFGQVTAVAAGIALAISWWPIIFSRIGIRPIMEPLFLVGAAWFWPRSNDWRRMVLAGTCLGLAFYTYTGAQVLFALPVLVAVGQLIWDKNTARRQILYRNGVVLLTAVLLTLPLYLTWRADPTLLQRMDQLVGPLAALRQGDLTPIIQSLVNTLAVFSLTGDPRWTYSLPGRPLFDLFTSLFFYLGLVVAAVRIRQQSYLFLLAWLLVGLLPSMLTPQSPSTIRMIGALPAVYVLVGVGLSWLWQRFSRRETSTRLRIVGYSLFLAFILVTAGRTIWGGFIQWPQAVETRLNHYQTVYLDIARYQQANPAQNLIITDPFFEQIDNASFQRTLNRDIVVRWLQAGPDVAGAMIFPADGENGRIAIPEYAPLSPTLLSRLTMPDEPEYRSPGTPSFSVYALPPTPSLTPLPAPITFSGLITLEGYEILAAEAGRPFTLATLWRVENTLPWNLTAFVHLLNSQGDVVAQHDGFDAAALTLRPGDTILQLHTLPLPQNNEEEPFTLLVGLYTPDNKQRLTHPGEPADFVILEPSLHFDEKEEHR